MEGIDCATRLNATTATALKNAGIMAVGRYLGYKNLKLWNSMIPDEVKAVFNAGLSIFLIWETNPTQASYFNYRKGVSDAKMAIDEANHLGAPQGIAIYFAVDYDAQLKDFPAIIEYFRGVKEGLAEKYLVGAYGSYGVLAALKGLAHRPDRYYQTYAWSGGKIFSGHIYQYQNGITLYGVEVDRDTVRSDAGLWTKEGYKLEHAVIYFSDRDFSLARMVSDKLGGCAMFCRNGNNANIHKDAKAAKHLVVIGGAEVTDHTNVKNCCGAGAPETAILAAQYAQTL